MNANLTQLTPKFSDWLDCAKKSLQAVEIDSAQLDAELLLAHALNCDRTYLHAHSDQIFGQDKLDLANSVLDRRLNREPIAYITGSKEFYGRDFKVTKDTLIPRPESEQIIDSIKEIYQSKTEHYNFIDVGTGTGCLGISAKLEIPNAEVTLIDISESALAIAKINSENLEASVNIIKNNLLGHIDEKFDAIIANLPYVDKEWDCSPEIKFEPSLALFADNKGLYLIEKLLIQSIDRLKPNGRIFIECDIRQHEDVISFATSNNYVAEKTNGLILTFINQY